MRSDNKEIEFPLVVEDDLAFHGMATEGATVRAGGRLFLHGTVIGDLIVELGGQVFIRGTVNGVVVNEAGLVEVYGTIEHIVTAPGARTFVDPNAVVRSA